MKPRTHFLTTLFAVCLAMLGALPAWARSPGEIANSPPPRAADPSHAQTSTIRFERIAVEDGLSQNAVLAILQDQRGFMWFGTEDGLNQYDGYGFTVYKHDPDDPATLSDNFVSTLYQSRSGDLWIGTRSGLDRLVLPGPAPWPCRATAGGPRQGSDVEGLDRTAGTFIHYQHDPDDPGSLGGTWVVAIYEDSEGRLWVGTEDGGLDQLDRATDTFTHYRHDPDDLQTLSDNTVRAIYQDHSGELWVGTHGGLNRLVLSFDLAQDKSQVEGFDRTTGTFIHYQHDPNDPQSLSSNEVSAVFEDRQGVLWIGTEGGGLNQLDRSSGTFIRHQHDPDDPRSLSHDRVRAVFEDSTGRLWVGTQNGLDLFDRDRNQFVHYRHNANDLYSLSSNAVWSIYEDRTGVLWFGTYGGGLSKYNRTTDQFTLYQHNPDLPNSLSDNMVWSIYEDRRGTLWIGTFNGGLNRLDRASDTFTVYRHAPEDPNSLSSDDVRAILEDRTGLLWVGTGAGLDQFDPRMETFVHYRHDPDDPGSLSADRVTVLYEDQSGNLWVGTRTGGLNRLDRTTGTFARYQHDPDDPFSLSDDRVWALYGDATGKLWVGTLGGVNLWDPVSHRFTRYLHDPDDPQSLSNDAVFSFYEDPSGMVWVGTWGSGLDRFDRVTQTFAHYTEKDGLANNVIYGIEADSEGFLWLSTNKGLSRFDPRTEGFQNYDVSDGLQNNEFNVGAHFRSVSGELFFGGIQGFNAFYPARVTGNPHAPPLVITTFSKFNQVVRRDLSPGEHIQLSYKDNFISFEFAALDYTAPEKNQYAYKMEGFDRDWVDAGRRRYASYTNLPGGDYTFRVKGSNNDGVWNAEGIAVHLTVTPPFWETWWFRGTVLLVLVGGVIGGYRLRVRSVEARSRELERQVEGRTAELQAERNFIAAILDTAGILVVVLDREGCIVRFNRACERTTGYSSDEVEGRHLWDLLLIPEEVELVRDVFEELWAGQFPNEAENFWVTKDGQRRLIAWSNTALLTDEGEVEYIVGTGIDITERRQAEEALSESEAKYRDLVENATSAILQMDTEGNITFFNRFAQEFFGYSEEEILGRNVVGTIVPEKDTTGYDLRAKLEDVVRHPERYYSSENENMRKDGERVWVAWTNKAIYDKEGRLVEVLCIGIDRTERKRAEEALKRQMREKEALYRADEEMLRYLKLDEVLQALVDVAVDILQADKGSLLVWDAEQERLVVKAARGFSPETIAQMSFARGEGTVGRVIVSGEAATVEDTYEDLRVARRITDPEGIRSFMHLPIEIGGQTFGVFNVDYTQPRAFGDDELRLFTALAQRAALAIENAQLYEQAQELAVVKERSRLARDLHDAVSQTLFSASLIAEVLPRLWERDPDEGRRRLQELRELTRGALAEMRTLLLELRPTVLEEAELGDLLRQLAESITGRARVPVTVQVEGECPLSPEVKVALYRIAQEALNNIAKHAGANQATIGLHSTPGVVKLQVGDDGRGFDPSAVPPKSLGVGIMRERAEAVGAELTIHSQVGRGTRVVVVREEKG